MPCYRSSPVILENLLHLAWAEDFCHMTLKLRFVREMLRFLKVTIFEFSRQKFRRQNYNKSFFPFSKRCYYFLKNCNINVTFCMGFQSRDMFAKT